MDPLTEKQQEFVRVIEPPVCVHRTGRAEVQKHTSPYRWQGIGRKQGRSLQGEVRAAKEPKRLDLQLGRSLAENVADLPQRCDVGAKTDAKGQKTS